MRKGGAMTKVSTIASQNYPAENRIIVQEQSSVDGVNWTDGQLEEVPPGGRASSNVKAAAARFYVSSNNVLNGGNLQFGGNAQIRIVVEGWNGQEWYQHQVNENPSSPYEGLDAWFGGGFRLMVEGK